MPPRRDRFLVDQRVKILQQFADGVRVEPLAERGKAGKIDEDDGGILPDRLEQEVGIAGQPSCEARRLELFEQLGSARRNTARVAGPTIAARRRTGWPAARRRRSVVAALSHIAVREREQHWPPPRPATTAAAASRPTALRRQASRPTSSNGSTIAIDGIDDANRPIAHDAVARDQMRDGGRNDFDARHQRIERRREEIAAAGDGRAEHDDAVLDVLAVDLAVDALAALTVRMVRRGP